MQMAQAKARKYIELRKGVNGNSYRVKIKMRSDDWPSGYYTESETFETRAKATKWGKERVTEINDSGIPSSKEVKLRNEKILNSRLKHIKLGALIVHHIEEHEYEDENGEIKSELRDSIYYGLMKICTYPIAKKIVATLTKADLDEFCKERRTIDKVTGYTAYLDIGYIKSVIYCAKDYGVNGSVQFIEDAMKQYRKDYKSRPQNALIEFKAKVRTTKITEKDFEILRQGLQARQEHRTAHIPYLTILDFAIATCMRIGEICRITWKDFKEDNKTLIIRNRKHPIAPFDQTIPLIGGAYELLRERKLKAMNSRCFSLEDRIFPYKAESVGAGWTNTRKKLIAEHHNLERIVFHDLRAHGATKLLKEGWDIKMVQIVTGHTNLNVLSKIYARIDPEDVIEEYDKREKIKETIKSELR
jgi:integrase